MENRKKRFWMSLSGILLCGISIALFRMADWGTDPFQTFCGGLEALSGMTFGILYVLINGAILMFVFLINKKYIGLATVLNMTLMGFIVEWVQKWLTRALPAEHVAGQAAYLLAGVVLLCISSSLYFTADLGVSTYDAVALILTEKRLARFQICRIGCDCCCVLIGFLCGAPVGIGTIVTALCMGPVIEYFNVHLSRPLLRGGKENV